MTDSDKQEVYAAKRRAVTGATAMEIRTYRVTHADGGEVTERVIGLSQVAAKWPHAVRVELLGQEKGAFW